MFQTLNLLGVLLGSHADMVSKRKLSVIWGKHFNTNNWILLYIYKKKNACLIHSESVLILSVTDSRLRIVLACQPKSRVFTAKPFLILLNENHLTRPPRCMIIVAVGDGKVYA